MEGRARGPPPMCPRPAYKAALATSPLSLPLPLLLPPPFASPGRASKNNPSQAKQSTASLTVQEGMMDAAEAARRSSSASSSAEFQFWPLDANPTASPSCADELFAGGVLLPLPVLPPKASVAASSHKRSGSGHVSPAPEQEPAEPEHEHGRGDGSLLPAAATAPAMASGAAITSQAPPAGAAGGGGGSKRWTDIFSKKPSEEKRKDVGTGRKPAAPAGNSGGSELNINIWPFSRSRSAGGSVSGPGSASSSKPRPPPPPRKASSAPCSRSNSRGEAGPLPPRRWAASPGRAGVPVGRSRPVWQIRRGPAASKLASEPFADRRTPHQHREKDKAATSASRKNGGLGGGVRGLNLSVNSCIGYRHQVSCRRAVAARGHGGGLFGIKGFFSKKVH